MNNFNPVTANAGAAVMTRSGRPAQVMCILREAGPTWGQRVLYQVDGFHFSVDDAGKRSTDKDSEYDLQMVDGARS